MENGRMGMGLSAIMENGRMGMGPHLWFEVESDIGMDHRVSDLLLLRPHQNKSLRHATSRPLNLDTECTFNCYWICYTEKLMKLLNCYCKHTVLS